ncbi:flagellar basal body P-ring formation chaperone FlgA [Sneathiella glossodoripedis]|uniref:flagellar basal body P-ring formation chaperone FlgA n=1 Tax=Sneathiella glossodoripedis TaxID=418853 RepID=UPI000470A1AF|nr:flagellar basal body P-ring formation chaperone FlgA [Sneathiella glossodoripedis]
MKQLIKYILPALLTLQGVSLLQAAEVTLKHNISVEGESITFGDVFHGAAHKSDYVIASSPAPGKRIVFNASSLAFVAKKHGLSWTPKQAIRQISVLREGTRIPEQQIREELMIALETELGGSEFEMQLSQRTPAILVGTDEDPIAMVENISYNLAKEAFSAILVAPATSDNPRRYKVSGKIYKQILVPVASRLIPAGEVISETNMDYKLVRANRVSRNVAVHMEDVLGRSPKRAVRTGGTIALNNLGDPVTVAKGKLVAVTLKNGGIALSITGRALESGSTGDIIRVENINSRKPVQAQIVSPQEVRIITAQQRLAAIQ